MECTLIQQLWQAEEAPVAHFTVLRALPHQRTHAVGPFVFLDHFGPAQASPETLPAHPHAGIEVMPLLLEGANEHRDSLGHTGVVESGGCQWMRAGSGILHAETNLPERNPRIHGLQVWARLPTAMQNDAPQYRAIHGRDVVRWQEAGAAHALYAGNLGERRGPIPLATGGLLLLVDLPPHASVVFRGEQASFEYGVYGVGGSARLAGGVALERGGFALFGLGQTLVSLDTQGDGAQVLIMGGPPAERPLVFGGPFVLDSHQSLRQAHQRYASGQMGTLDGVPF